MSETTETSSTKVRVHRNRAKRKFSRGRLPTPPPDPMASEDIVDQPASPTESYTIKDVHFLEYINSLQKSPHLLNTARSDSIFGPVTATEDAFDHLEKLYKLMEQMLNLRQQNARLQRRVRDLEHLKNLQSMHRHLDSIGVFEDIPEMDDDSSFTESILDTMLTGTKKEVKPKSWTRSRIRQSLMRRQRNRSTSLNERADSDEVREQRRSSAINDREKPAKVSKWTKVKAAFKWEKASPSVSGAKSHDSGISGIQPVNCEVACYLRVPSTSEDVGISPNDSGAADGSTPGTLSSASSADDIYRQDHKSDVQISDDDRHSINMDDGHMARGIHHTNSKKLSRVKMRNVVTPSSENSYEKNRLSTRSDDTKNDTSDNDDVENKHRDSVPEGNANIKKSKQSVRSREKREIPVDVIARYRQAIVDDETGKAPKRVSKWTRVKKAFLTPSASSVANTKSKSNHSVRSSLSRPPKEIQSTKSDNETRRIQDEIQKNYRQLQKKLSLEFHDKLKEWEKAKTTSPNLAVGSHCRSDGITDEHKDQAFLRKMEEWQRIKSQPPRSGQGVQMIREENLAPEFKKKLEEWQKIKKYAAKDDSVSASKAKKKLGEWPKWKSVSGQRDEPHPHEHQPLSDEFLKKLEEWRRIKDTNRSYETSEKTPSPKPARKQSILPSTSGQSKKDKTDPKELQWFEKELDKIEQEKQRLEHERQKFLQREERLTRLRRAVMGNGNKKDILIHTPSGFYKFEGISRKFTQKLCEWEKAQGIGPEASTFALLTSHFTPHITVDFYETDTPAPVPQYGGSKLIRSKSAESLTVSNLIQPMLPTSHHPSSLSLNDVDELEKQCLEMSRESSMQDIDGSLEKLRSDEPEAVIVEVEDVVEETASPLEERLEEKHFPVYQREMALNTCEGRSLIVPCIQRMDSKSAQYTYFLIEEIMNIIKNIEEGERSPQQAIHDNQSSRWSKIELEESQPESESDSQSPDLLRLEDKNEIQKQRSDTVLEKLIRLQEIHSKNISDVAIEGYGQTSMHFTNLLEAAQDSFLELLQMAEQLQNFLHNRCGEIFYKISFQFTDSSYSDVTAITSELLSKLSELKRILTYFYAASDKTAPGRKVKCPKKSKKEQKNAASNNLESREQYECKNNDESLDQSQDDHGKLVAKRLRYKKKSKTLYESEDSDINEPKVNLSKTPEGRITKEKIEMVIIDPVIVQKLVIPTKTNILDASCPASPVLEKKPVEVFVKTTRKLFTPVVESQGAILTSSPSCSTIDLDDQDQDKSSDSKDVREDVPIVRLPPLASPSAQRKTSKEISPSIRLMLAKYNQMISEQDGSVTTKSACSSGSASPVAWRSPVSERRVKAQKERYLEEIRKSNNKCNEVKKSASVSVLNSDKRTAMHQTNKIIVSTSENSQKPSYGILRSTSAGVLQVNDDKPPCEQDRNPNLKLVIRHIPTEESKHSLEMRYNKIQKAKEEFLNSTPTPTAGPSSAPPVFPGEHENITKYPTRSRFSQISMGSESSYDSSAYEGMLVKSASAGMINVDEDTYKKIDPAFHCDGYLSLPRSVQKQKEGFLGGKLALSNIAAKFRKVRMRRNKDQKKMNTVSVLCRQSLLVDINPDNQEAFPAEKQNRRESLTVPSENRASSSEDTSPSSSRSGSWIRRSRIFKNL